MQNLPSLLSRFSALAFVLTGFWSSAQTDIPPFEPVFAQGEVTTFHITMDADSAEAMLNGDLEYASSNVFPAELQFISAGLDTIINTLGIRLRGNTSVMSPKKSFKIDLNAFIPGQKFADLEKINLNANQNDPSVLRAALSWNILRKMGLTGARTGFSKVTINGENMGVYVNTEHFDEEFVEEYYDKDKGNFYKCLWPAQLDFIGDDPELYKFENNGRRAYDLKTNKEADDYTDIAAFIDILNNTPEADFPCAIEQVFNVADYLKVMAVDVISGNWDGYAGNKNNFYLYHNPQTGLFDYIAYDLDNTWGIDWVNQEWEERDPYAWATEERPLYDRLMAVPEYRDWYTHYLREVAGRYAHPDSVLNFLETQASVISSEVQTDAYYPLSFGFDFTAFAYAIDYAWGEHVEYGIAPWLDARLTSLNAQMDAETPILVAHELEDNAPVLDSLRVRAILDAGGDNLEATLWIDAGSGAQAYPMFDDGEHGDRQAGDGTWGIKVDIPYNWVTVDYQVQATSSSGLERWLPCAPKTVTVGMSPTNLVINELMSANANNVSDGFGEFDDWAELFNAGNTSVALGGKYLTDNLSNPGKYALPEGDLAAGDWAFYWLDNDPEQGELHAPFTLSSSGDELALTEWNEAAGIWVILDFFPFGLSEQDISLGRLPDGEDYWVWFATPTADYSNNYAIVFDVDGPDQAMKARQFGPNPTRGCVRWTGAASDGAVLNRLGQPVAQFASAKGVCLTDHPSGWYSVVLRDGSRFQLIKAD
ncbi:MAG: CotH kinase family protein [Flavobacteriales bacterium]|nr:CotH kinase family protein [Flavobacteriales bacterium]